MSNRVLNPKKIFVVGIDGWDSTKLSNYFSKYGMIVRCKIVESKKKRNFAFITYSSKGMADKAKAQFEYLRKTEEIFVRNAYDTRDTHDFSASNTLGVPGVPGVLGVPLCTQIKRKTAPNVPYIFKSIRSITVKPGRYLKSETLEVGHVIDEQSWFTLTFNSTGGITRTFDNGFIEVKIAGYPNIICGRGVCTVWK